MKWWRNEKHPRYRSNLPGSDALVLARQERRRAVYVALTRAADHLYVSASRAEATIGDIEPGEDDHFAELLSWALANPEAAEVIQRLQVVGGEEIVAVWERGGHAASQRFVSRRTEERVEPDQSVRRTAEVDRAQL